MRRRVRAASGASPRAGSACAGVPWTRIVPHVARSPATATRAASASVPCAPTRCPRRRPSNSPSASRSPGRSGHSVESTISRSTMPTSCSNSRDSQSGPPRQRQNTGRSEIRSGSTIEAGAVARLPRSVSSITSPQTARSPTGKQRIETLRVETVVLIGLRHEQQRPRRVALGHPGERLLRCALPLGRRPRDVRHHRCAEVRLRAFLRRLGAQPRQLALDLRDRDVLARPGGFDQ